MVQIDTSQRSKGFFEKHGFEAKNVTENYYAPGLHRVDMELRNNDNVSFAGS
jgi:ribosomal protein S18 acetylase RimI-like enzyme